MKKTNHFQVAHKAFLSGALLLAVVCVCPGSERTLPDVVESAALSHEGKRCADEVSMRSFFGVALNGAVKSRGTSFWQLNKEEYRLPKAFHMFTLIRARKHPNPNGAESVPTCYYVDTEDSNWSTEESMLKDVESILVSLKSLKHDTVDITVLYDGKRLNNISIFVKPGNGGIVSENGRPYTMGVL